MFPEVFGSGSFSTVENEFETVENRTNEHEVRHCKHSREYHVEGDLRYSHNLSVVPLSLDGLQKHRNDRELPCPGKIGVTPVLYDERGESCLRYLGNAILKYAVGIGTDLLSINRELVAKPIFLKSKTEKEVAFFGYRKSLKGRSTKKSQYQK